MNFVRRLRLGAIAVCCGVGFLAACTITLVTPYDDTFDQEITSTQKDVDSLMSKISDNPTAAYSSFKDDYAKVKTDIDAMDVRANSHTNNTDTLKSVAIIQETFGKFQSRHTSATSADPLTKEFVDGELSHMNLQFQILMGQELLKKSGQDQGSKQ